MAKKSSCNPSQSASPSRGKRPMGGKTSAAKKAKRAGYLDERSTADANQGAAAAKKIDRRIEELGDWRGEVLKRVRELIREAEPEIVEEWKWDTPVWSRFGIVCTGETYKKAVKLTFARGASLSDPSGLFNSSLGGKVRRAIDIHEGDKLNAASFKKLVRAAVAFNRKEKEVKVDTEPVLLSGGNPQIAKGEGDGPVQAYIAAMPGWKRDIGRHLDEIIVRVVPGVRKAVKWNSPLYGVEGRGWFLGIHCFTKYVKVAFFRGTSLSPVPPGSSKAPETRYLNIREDEPLDEAQFADWVRQASQLPGERL